MYSVMVWTRRFRFLAIALFLFALPTANAEKILNASHQWPGDQGDIRDEMIHIFANEVKNANIGIKIKIYPHNKLYRPKEQWGAMVRGELDLSVFPLAYASIRHPEFNLTLMPGLIKNYAHAQRMNKSRFMRKIRNIIHSAGVVVLADVWLAGGTVSKNKCILVPGDLKGQRLRGAGKAFNEMFSGAKAKIVTMPSSELYAALKTGVLDGASTSSTSLISYKLYEQVSCLTAPGKNTLWFMYEPLLMSKQSYDNLSPEQKKALHTAGEKAEAFAYDEAIKVDKRLIKIYKENGVKVVTMSDEQAAKWRSLINETSHKNFIKEVKGGKELLKMALSVE